MNFASVFGGGASILSALIQEGRRLRERQLRLVRAVAILVSDLSSRFSNPRSRDVCQNRGCPTLGNTAYSDAEIVEELGQEHLSSDRPILYTSADSVSQAAAHEEVVPLSTLYQWCQDARGMLVAPHNVNRVVVICRAR